MRFFQKKKCFAKNSFELKKWTANFHGKSSFKGEHKWLNEKKIKAQKWQNVVFE